jgi:uncharacterized protein YegP (UPF0339 family)
METTVLGLLHYFQIFAFMNMVALNYNFYVKYSVVIVDRKAISEILRSSNLYRTKASACSRIARISS